MAKFVVWERADHPCAHCRHHARMAALRRDRLCTPGGLPAVTPPTPRQRVLSLNAPSPLPCSDLYWRKGIIAYGKYFSLLSSSSSEIMLCYPSLTLKLLQALTRARCAFPSHQTRRISACFKAVSSPSSVACRGSLLKAGLEERHSQVTQLVSPVLVWAAPPGGTPDCGRGGP